MTLTIPLWSKYNNPPLTFIAYLLISCKLLNSWIWSVIWDVALVSEIHSVTSTLVLLTYSTISLDNIYYLGISTSIKIILISSGSVSYSDESALIESADT